MAIAQQDPRLDTGNQSELPTELSAPAPSPARGSSHRHKGAPCGWLLASAVVLIVVVAVGMTQPPGAPARQLWATAAGNPAVMFDTATAAYYRQLVQLNQGLTAQGGKSIELSKFFLGPIIVNGTGATATTSETWITTSSDGLRR